MLISRRRLLSASSSAILIPTALARASYVPGVSSPGLSKIHAVKIQAFGDSISSSSNGQYFPSDSNLSNIPAWMTGVAVPANRVVKSNGLVFYALAAGTTGSTAPTPSALNDGGVTWVWLEFTAEKFFTGYLAWLEAFSQGRLRWDMADGYPGCGGLYRVIVQNGGAGYVSPAVAFSNGATGMVRTSGGVITGVDILSPGYGPGTVSISDTGGGTGCILSAFQGGWGTMGVPGETTSSMLLRLSDPINCDADIVVVHAGTNDVHAGTAPATTIANLRTFYEAIMSAGKGVIAAPITPAYTLVMPALADNAARVNRWIRAYVRGEKWANPLGFRNIALADVSGFYEDGTNNTAFWPIGGGNGSIGTTPGAMTQDGIHPSQRGAAYWGYVLWQACQRWVAPAPDKVGGIFSAIDGYDPVRNPSGNMLEGLPCQPSAIYSPGALGANANGDLYYVSAVTGNATSGAASPPSGGGSAILDGNVTWAYTGYSLGRSNLSAGATGAQVAAAGIVYSGSLCKNFQIGRSSGTASGTVACGIENPWSNGQIGQRQSIAFTMGAGTANELWYILVSNALNANYGIIAADLGAAQLYAEADIEISNVANCSGVVLQLSGDRMLAQTGSAQYGAGTHIPNSFGEMITLPNAGRMILRTQPMVLHPNNTNLSLWLRAYFDASGAAGSSTLTLKINQISLRRYGVA